MWELPSPVLNYTKLATGCPVDESGKVTDGVFGVSGYWRPTGPMSFINMSPDNDKTNYQQRVCRRCLAFYCAKTK